MIRDDVFRDALALPPADRRKLLRKLLESLDLKMPEEGADLNAVARWEEEFVRRIINKGGPPAPKPPTRH